MEEVTATASTATESVIVEPQSIAAADEQTPTAVETTATPRSTTTTPENPAMNKPAQKSRTKRPELYADDIDEMMAVMLKKGTTGAAADVFHAMLEAFQQQGALQQQHQAEGLGEMGKALNRFLDRIQALESTVSELQDERDRLLANQEQLGELQRLQTENQQLRSELEQAKTELADPRKMLERVLAQSATASIAPTTTEPPNTVAPALRSNIAPASPPAQRPAKEARSSEPKSRSLDDTKRKIGEVIDAMISWNSSQPSSNTMLAISIPAIKGIAGAIGAGYQKAIQEVLAEREDELKDLGDHWMLGQRHNATVRGKDDILKSIARENMGLENWENVKFA